MIFFLDFLLSVVGVLLSVAFFTLMERKIMGLSHYRKGPSKVITWGLCQPISDAAKLLTKENNKYSSYKMVMFLLGPGINLLLMILCWGWYNYLFSVNSCEMKIMMVFSCMSLTAYGFLMTSWGSNSKYALIGGHRAIAQIISYEVCLMLFILVVVYTVKSFSFKMMSMMQENLWYSLACLPLFLTWLMICMAETNRTPFDLAEGESEIVSGFNIEYGGGLFALLFIAEYGMIIFLSFLTVAVFTGMKITMAKTFLVCIFFVWVRCSFPRVRYDHLMMMSWKIATPFSLAMLSSALMV